MATRFIKNEDNSSSINTMLLSSKKGNWDIVFDILEDKPILINCISSERAWGVLHQAAWMNDFPVVEQLLHIPGCDPAIKTKQDGARKYGPGKTPRELSSDHVIQCYLLEAERKSKYTSQIEFTPTCVFAQNEFELTGHSISLALSCFKKVLCSKLDFDDSYTFTIIMNAIFQECLTNWEKIRNKISQALQVDNSKMSKFLRYGFQSRSGKSFDTMEKFFSRVIKAFTDERDSVYKNLNVILGNPHHAPKGYDIALAGYAVLLNAILMNWKALNKCKRYTYRCIGLDAYDLSLYKVGMVYTWLNFSSSSIQREVAEEFSQPGLITVTFIIENKSSNRWSGRYISAHSAFPEENECLYPCGARFVVTRVNGTDVYLKLSTYD